jgi:hypothetical protein
MGAVACGSDPAEPEAPTTVLTEPEPITTDTTGYADNPCFKFPVEVLRLQNDYRLEQRGVAGPPDIARYRARAQALVDEAQALGCPRPVGLNQFLG